MALVWPRWVAKRESSTGAGAGVQWSQASSSTSFSESWAFLAASIFSGKRSQQSRLPYEPKKPRAPSSAPPSCAAARAHADQPIS